MITTETPGTTTVTSAPRLVQLKDICDRITKGSTPTSYGFKYTREGIRFIKAENIDKNGLASTTTDYIDEATNEFLNRSILQEHDILFSIAGTIGRVGIVRRADLPANTNQALAILRLLPGIIERRYLFYYLKSDAIQKDALKRVVGVGRANLSLTNIGEFAIPLISLDQQKQIVAEIEKQFSRLDEAVANLKRVKANLKRYKASVLKAAVEGKLTEDFRKQHPNVEPASKLVERILTERRAKWTGRGKYKEPDSLDTIDLSPLASSWKWVSLDQVFLNITDGDHQPPPQTDSGVPFLVIGNVRSGKLEFEDTRFVSRQYADAVDTFRKPARGDILYTLVGSFGIALRVDTNREFCIQRHIGVLRPHKLSPTSYLVHVLNSSLVFNQATNVATGTAQKTVPLAGLRRFAIPLAPLAEQQQVVAEVERRFSVIEELEVAIEANLIRADRLRQSILSTAFSGRLAVSESEIARRANNFIAH